MNSSNVISRRFDDIVEKHEAGTLERAELHKLRALVLSALQSEARQNLLYLHAQTPSLFSKVIGYTPIPARPGSQPTITATPGDWPCQTVHEAILDGWQVIHFPNQGASFDDHEIDILGYEFILQKLEFDHGDD